MSEHDSERVGTEDAEVEGHNFRKPGHGRDSEAPEGAGERGSDDTADVEGHSWRKPGH